MALTQVKTTGLADDAVTTDKLANAINTERTANTAKTSLEDNAVTLAKMAGGTDGQIITYDASGDPVAVGPGTDGQVLTSTGAGSPPAFEDAAASGAALTGSTNNTIVTVTGANAIQGEAGLTFDGSTLNFTAASGDARLSLFGTEGNDARITLCADEGDDHIDQWNIRAEAANHFVIDQFSGGSFVERLRIGTEADNGDVTVKTGDLLFGTAGKGICLGATSNTNANTLDDYEEGTFTPTIKHDTDATGATDGVGAYTKVGNMVNCNISFINKTASSIPNGAIAAITGLPFTANHPTGQADGFSTCTKPIEMSIAQRNGGLWHTVNGTTKLRAHYMANNSTWAIWYIDDFNNNSLYLIFNITYWTDS